MSMTTDQQAAQREHDIAVMANAIGWALYSADGREVTVVDGVERIDTTDEETAVTLAAAERAYDHLHSIRQHVVLDLVLAIHQALAELGVSDNLTPAPVANAVRILSNAIRPSSLA